MADGAEPAVAPEVGDCVPFDSDWMDLLSADVDGETAPAPPPPPRPPPCATASGAAVAMRRPATLAAAKLATTPAPRWLARRVQEL
jgi:hypothetical protein